MLQILQLELLAGFKYFEGKYTCRIYVHCNEL